MKIIPSGLLGLALCALAGCPEAETDATDKGEDTAGVTDDTSVDTCNAALTAVSPTDGAMSVYYRDPVVLTFEGDASAAVITVADPSGAAASLTTAWSDGSVQATLTGALVADTEYTITVVLCDVTTESQFTTSSVGASLTSGPEELVGNVYSFALNDAEITEPAVLEAFDDASLTSPLLFEVIQADASTITLMGALGELQGGQVVQVSDAPVWDFPAANFSESPYFETYTEFISIAYGSVNIPIYEFTFRGDFTSDGSAITHASVEGLVDTRPLGPLFNLGEEEDAVCAFASDFGVYCTTCPDDTEYCLFMVGEDIEAPLYPDLDIVAPD